jgi:DNA-binding YbaB/EbfC family protein
MAMGMKDLMKQAQKMQRDMLKAQDALAAQEFEGTAGGGQVVIKMNGHSDLLSVRLQKEVVDPNDVEMLEDLILAAYRNAKEKTSAASESLMGGLTGGMKIPGLM